MRVVCAFVLGGLLIGQELLGAQRASARTSRLAKALGGIAFGSSFEEVQAVLRRRIQQRYETLLHAAEDPIARRELEKKLQREVEAVIVGHTKFDGQRTGMEVGIAGDEFKHGTGESALRVREADIERYYFFIGGKLWKVFGAYVGDTVKQVPFVPFLAQMRRKYGRPLKLQRAQREGERVIVAAEWRSRGVHLEIRDRTEFFQSYTESFTDPNVRARIDDLRGKPASKKGDVADALIELVTSGNGARDDNGNGNGDAKADPTEPAGATSGDDKTPRNKNDKRNPERVRRRRVVDIH